MAQRSPPCVSSGVSTSVDADQPEHRSQVVELGVATARMPRRKRGWRLTVLDFQATNTRESASFTIKRDPMSRFAWRTKQIEAALGHGGTASRDAVPVAASASMRTPRWPVGNSTAARVEHAASSPTARTIGAFVRRSQFQRSFGAANSPTTLSRTLRRRSHLPRRSLCLRALLYLVGRPWVEHGTNRL